MSHTVTTEIERKYEVPEGASLPAFTPESSAAVPPMAVERLGALVAEVVTLDPVQLEAVYFDTADGALARARIALRRRRGGHDEGWHVKLPAAEGRTELQWPLDPAATPAAQPTAPAGDVPSVDASSADAGSADAGPSSAVTRDTDAGGPGAEAESVPAVVLDAVRVHVRDRDVTPLARIATTRRITELRAADGSVVAEIADDTVATTDLREGTARAWREWEAELGPAAPGTAKARARLLDVIEQHLMAAGATVSPSVSKLAQAMGRTGLGVSTAAVGASASASAQQTEAPAGEPTPSARAAGVVRAGLAELTASLIELDPRARTDEPGAVHRLRTTVRRLRSALATHRALLSQAGPDAASELAVLRDSLSRFGAALGEVRDLEVRADWADDALGELERGRGVDDPDARRRLVQEIRDEKADAHRRLVATMSRVPYFRLLDALEAFVTPRPTETGVDSAALSPASSERALGKASGKAGGRAGKAKAGKASGTSSAKATVKASSKPAAKEAERALAREGRRAAKRTVKADEALAVLEGDTVEVAHALGALHDSRKAARRLRYAAEFSSDGAAGVLGATAEHLAEAAEDLQDALGWHRDASLFAEFVLLTSRRADAAGESSFTYGVLYQRALDQSRRALRLADDARRILKRRV